MKKGISSSSKRNKNIREVNLWSLRHVLVKTGIEPKLKVSIRDLETNVNEIVRAVKEVIREVGREVLREVLKAY